MRRSFITRALHALGAAAVTAQLLLSLVMEEPEDGPAGPLFELHETVGLSTLAILAAWWLWIALRGGETPIGVMLPWFSRRRLRDLGDDLLLHLRALLQLDLPPWRASAPLASAVHGLGLLAATGSAATGATWWLAGGGSAVAAAAKELHEGLGTLVWAYVIGHVALALLHHRRGEPVLGAMKPW